MKKFTALALLILWTQNPGMSADETSKAARPGPSLDELAQSKDSVLSKRRGGFASKKPLGFYLEETSVVFRSPYASQSPQLMAEFAKDLHGFVTQGGGGYSNFIKHARAGDTNPMNAAHVSYQKQLEFAQEWWSNHSTQFKKSTIQRGIWLDDAVLDANDLWLRYEAVQNPLKVSDDAERVLYQNWELKELAAKR